MSDLSDLLTIALLIWVTWAIRWQSLICLERSERISHSCSFDLSKMSDERMSKFPALWFAGDSSYIRLQKTRDSLEFSNDFDSFPPFYASFIALRSFALFKDQLEQFSPVAHDKRATGAICSFSRSNCSLAFSLKKKKGNRSKNRCPNSKPWVQFTLLFHSS